jgi:hypothetical protein
MRLLVPVACLVAGLVAAGTLTNLNKRLVNPGTGIVSVAGSIAADTAVMASQAVMQAGTPWKCRDTGNDGHTFSCAPVPALSGGYTDMQPVIFSPGSTCIAGTHTLNLSAQGMKRIVKGDGVTDLAAGDCTKGLPMLLFFVQALDSGAGAFLTSK